jgi:transposase
VKPFVKRQKNDAADAAAIAEAALRPNLHYVAVKSAEQQARAVAFRTHQSFVGQRTQLINALRGHLAEFGLVVAQGPSGIKAVGGMIDDDATDIPGAVRDITRVYLDQIAVLTQKIDELHFKLRAATKIDDAMRRLCTVPGVGPVTAGAIMAFAPDLRTFASGRNFAAWLGLVPRHRSTGGKTRLGGVSKMGQSDIRKLLIVGAPSTSLRTGPQDPVDYPARHIARQLAGTRARTQTPHGGGRRLGQQNGAYDLGDDDA